MENEESLVTTFTNLDPHLNPVGATDGWTNLQAQGIEMNFRDPAGSFLQSYTLQWSRVYDNSPTPTFPGLGSPSSYVDVP